MKGFFYQIKLFREKSYRLMVFWIPAEVFQVPVFIHGQCADAIRA